MRGVVGQQSFEALHGEVESPALIVVAKKRAGASGQDLLVAVVEPGIAEERREQCREHRRECKQANKRSGHCLRRCEHVRSEKAGQRCARDSKKSKDQGHALPAMPFEPGEPRGDLAGVKRLERFAGILSTGHCALHGRQRGGKLARTPLPFEGGACETVTSLQGAGSVQDHCPSIFSDAGNGGR